MKSPARTIELIPADDLGVDDVIDVVTNIFQIEGKDYGNNDCLRW